MSEVSIITVLCSFYRCLQIIRGTALALSLIMYGREEGAETLIEQMSRDQDPILRYECSDSLLWQSFITLVAAVNAGCVATVRICHGWFADKF